MGVPLTMDSRQTLVPGWNREAPPPAYLSSQAQPMNGFNQPLYNQQPTAMNPPSRHSTTRKALTLTSYFSNPFIPIRDTLWG